MENNTQNTENSSNERTEDLIRQLIESQGPNDALLIGQTIPDSIEGANDELVNEMMELNRMADKKEKEWIQKYSLDVIEASGKQSYFQTIKEGLFKNF